MSATLPTVALRPALSPQPYPRTPEDQAERLRASLQRAGNLADALMTQMAEVKRQCEQLTAALAALDDVDLAALAAVDRRPTAPQGASTPGDGPTNTTAEVDPARLAALEMAIQGASRGEIYVYLRDELDIAEPQTVVDEVLRDRRSSS
jgi:hypothetical protein